MFLYIGSAIIVLGLMVILSIVYGGKYLFFGVFCGFVLLIVGVFMITVDSGGKGNETIYEAGYVNRVQSTLEGNILQLDSNRAYNCRDSIPCNQAVPGDVVLYKEVYDEKSETFTGEFVKVVR